MSNQNDDLQNNQKKRQLNIYCQQTYYVWSRKDERQLIMAINSLGRDWKKVQQQFFPTLTTQQIKNKYYSINKRPSLQQEDYEQIGSMIEEERSRANSLVQQEQADIIQYVMELLSSKENDVNEEQK